MQKKITTILWDVDNTLLDFDYSMRNSLKQCFLTVGVEECEEMINRYAQINDMYWKRLERGEVTKAQLLVGRFKDLLTEFHMEHIDYIKFKEEFQENLKQQDVMLTRSTSNTISYKLSNFRPIRGDSLGSDFTMLAIRNRLKYNQKKTGIDGKIKGAELRANGKHVLEAKEIDLLYDFGAVIGMSREEVGQLVDHALYASREGKKQGWGVWRANKDGFWESYRQSQEEISNHLNELYRKRKMLKQSEWMLNPYNTKMSLWGILFAFVLRLSSHTSLQGIEAEIALYKEIGARLRKNIELFKKASEKGIQSLKDYDFSMEEYLLAISQMHTLADNAMLALLDIPPERMWILTSDYQMVRESDLLEKQRLEER